MAVSVEKLDQIAASIREGNVGTAPPWVGADVAICLEAPPPSGGFYPDDRYVETKYVGELSWLFVELRNVFWKSDEYGFWKEEFFGRLGNVAIKYQQAAKSVTCEKLLLAVLHEAYAMAEEIKDTGTISSLMVTTGNQILDDYLEISDLSAYLSTEETSEFLKRLGLA